MNTEPSMTSKTFGTLVTLVALGVASAAGCSHDHGPEGEADHPHGPGDDHAGHDDHGAPGAPKEAELEGVVVTLWTERTELFMEYRPLIVGKESSFAAHVTEMPSFKAVTAGAMKIEVHMKGGPTQTVDAAAPTNPGIFRPVLVPTTAGECTMTLIVTSPQLNDRMDVPGCRVFPDEAAARAAVTEEAPGPEPISFLKEQQWVTDFATTPVAPRKMRKDVRALGSVTAASGRDVRVNASAAGWVDATTALPVLGTRVEAGQLLATLTPRPGTDVARTLLEADARGASAELAQAQQQLARADRLLADGAAPKREVDEARTRVEVARARSEGARARVAQLDAGRGGKSVDKGFEVRAPIAGTVVAADVVGGQAVEAGQALFRVVDLTAVWLVAHVFEPDLPSIAKAATATFTVPGDPTVHTIPEGRIVDVGRVLDPQRRTAPIVFALDNSDARLWVGQSAQVAIGIGPERDALAIPKSALVAEAGREIVYVMVDGESFERRVLTLGVADQQFVEVLSGLAAGERVVSVGGYEIKLAAASGIIPAHGHAH